MADDDVRKFDPDRTVLARGLPLATSTAKVRASIAVARAISPRSLLNSLGRSADFARSAPRRPLDSHSPTLTSSPDPIHSPSTSSVGDEHVHHSRQGLSLIHI